MRVAVIGATGQLGSDVMEVFENAIPFTHNDVEVTNPATLEAIAKVKPDVVINTAAFHKTDACEDDPHRTFHVNAVGALNVARLCEELGAICIYISTDYVFDGKKRAPYVEDDIPNPINVYGLSKYVGELAVMNYCKKHYVIRVASLYGRHGARGKGGNFVMTMIEKARKGEEIRVVDDMIMSPTYTKHVARGIKWMLENDVPYGLYHMVNEGYCSWYEFAKEIFHIQGINANLKPIKTEQLSLKAKRPLFSALKNKKLESLGYKLPHWKDALRAYLQEVKECHSNS